MKKLIKTEEKKIYWFGLELNQQPCALSISFQFVTNGKTRIQLNHFIVKFVIKQIATNVQISKQTLTDCIDIVHNIGYVLICQLTYLHFANKLNMKI